MSIASFTVEGPPIPTIIAHPKDQLAKSYGEKARENNLKPEEVVTGLMGSGVPSEVKNYCADSSIVPAVTKRDGRDMISLYKGIPIAPRFGMEAMQFAVENALEMKNMKGAEGGELYMLPYLHFREPGSIGPDVPEEYKQDGISKVTFVIITREQFDAVKKLLPVNQTVISEPAAQATQAVEASALANLTIEPVEPIIPTDAAQPIPAEQPQAAVPADVIATPAQIVTEPAVVSAPQAAEQPAAPVEEPTKVETPAEAALRELMAQTAGGSATPTPPATPTTPIVS